MSQQTIFWIIVGMAVGAYTLRAFFILLFGRIGMPSLLERALRFVPPAVLSALVIPALLFQGGRLNLSWGNERMIAGAAALLVAWRTRSILATLAVGMGLLWVLKALA
ncbi:MAG: AzlD domain-containing protein [Chloroflexi bacterium]|nr:MAG: AzlD domain-containing protein [Chloroflexota bacterium]